MSEVEYDVAGGVAVLTLTRGGTNALSPVMRAELAAALARAAEDGAVRAVVLTGAEGVFCSGVDLTEYDAPRADPWIDALTRAIETHPKPVVAALEGAALGAGFELALAAHARVARRTCRVALPEVKLGLMPSGGSTQRLPRLLGAQAALEFMLSGRSVVAGEPRLALLFDVLTDEPPLAAAKGLAKSLAARGAFARPGQVKRGFSDPMAYQKAVRTVAAQLRDPDGAGADILRCVEAAQLLPYEQGLAFEVAAFEGRLARPDARAARHIYTAERLASIWPEARAGAPREVRTVVLVGADPVLAELAVYCLDRGQRVAVLAADPAGEALVARARAVYEGAVARGRMAADERDSRMARLSRGGDAAVLAAADLVLDSGGGDLAAAPVKPGAVWCVLDAAAEAAARRAELGDRADFLGLRAYRPAHTQPLVEVAVPEGAAADAVLTVAQYFGGPGRSVLRVAARPGLLGHRIAGALHCAALALLRSGEAPEAVEDGARALGFKRGPLEMIEREGIGVVAMRLARIFGATPELGLLQARADAVAAGRTPGQGFYAPQGTALAPDPGLPAWLEAWRAGQAGLPGRSGVPIERALHAAVVAEAARALEAGLVARASDVDLCMIKGYGFDRARGGPLLWADVVGLLGLVRAMKALQPLGETIWAPPAWVEERVKYGRGVFDRAVS